MAPPPIPLRLGFLASHGGSNLQAILERLAESYRRIRVAIARINAYLQEHLTGMAVLQLFGREARSYDEFEIINLAHMKAYKDSIMAYGLFYPAVEFLGSLAVIGPTRIDYQHTITAVSYIPRLFDRILNES